MHQPILQLTAPRVTLVERQQAGRITEGDRAEVGLEPGIFALLMNPMGGSTVPVGKDLHPLSTVPAGIAIDAATEACGAAETGVGILRAMNLSLEAPVTGRDPLRAGARVVRLGRRSVPPLRTRRQRWLSVSGTGGRRCRRTCGWAPGEPAAVALALLKQHRED